MIKFLEPVVFEELGETRCVFFVQVQIAELFHSWCFVKELEEAMHEAEFVVVVRDDVEMFRKFLLGFQAEAGTKSSRIVMEWGDDR